MKRDLTSLKNQEFDLLVVGGGIQGACVALEAAKAGVKVALIEKNDFGSATSANSLKILHGGLRYLQHLDFPRMKQSIESRRYFAKLAPDLVKPLSCVIPTEKWSLKHPFTMWCALTLNDLISFRRNRGLNNSVKIPSGQILSRKKCQEFFPNVSHSFEMGGARWYDYLILNSERLTLECLHQASASGLVVANYTEAVDFVWNNDRVCGVKARDVLHSDETFEIKSKFTINTVGPWWNECLEKIKLNQTPSSYHFAKAVNVVVGKRLLGEHAIGLESEDPENADEKRFFFVVPWENGTMIGTTYKPVESFDPNALTVQSFEIDAILDPLREWFPDAKLNKDDVGYVHAGMLPIDITDKANGQKGYRLHGDTIVVNHGKEDHIQGLYSVKTVKYTTAPVVAKAFVDEIKGQCDLMSDCAHDQSSHVSVDPVCSVEDSFHVRYGSRGSFFMNLVQEDAGLEKTVDSEFELTKAEIIYFIREEMSCRLVDIILRRSFSAGGNIPSMRFLEGVSTIMSQELKWDQATRQSEIKAVIDYYQDRGMMIN